MIEEKLVRSYHWNDRLVTFVNHILVSLMMVCLVISFVQFLERLIPGWDGSYLPFLGFFIAMEAMYTKKALGRRTFLDAEWFIYRGSEWVVLLVILRLVVFQVEGSEFITPGMPLWDADYIRRLFSNTFLAHSAFTAVIWSISTSFSAELTYLVGDEQIDDRELLNIVLRERSVARKVLLNRVFLLGGMMVILAALVRLDLNLPWRTGPGVDPGGLNVLVYFLLGFTLFSLSQYAVLRASWTWEKTPVSTDLVGHWAGYSFLFLLALVFVVSLLPTNYSIGFLNLISYLIGAIWYLLMFVLSIFMVFLSLLSGLFGGSGPSENFVPPTAPPPMLLPDQAAYGSAPWIPIIRSMVFWLVFLGVIGFSITAFSRTHIKPLTRWANLRILRWMVKGISFFGGMFHGLNTSIRHAVSESVGRIRTLRRTQESGLLIRFFNPRRLPTREQVIFFYLAMIRSGQEKGYPRGLSQTPLEYAERLEGQLPELEPDVGEITDSFIKARYSHHAIEPERVGQVRQNWTRIRKSLRARKRR